MIKSELVKRILSQSPHLRLGDVERIMDVILDGIVMALADEKRVELRGLQVESKKMPFFKAGKEASVSLSQVSFS